MTIARSTRWTALLLFLVPTLALGGGITLTYVPRQLIVPTDTVRITWAEPVRATLKYGRSHESYPGTVSTSGVGAVEFVPSREGLRAGTYYCVVEGSGARSSEFSLIIESQTAPRLLSPPNQSVVTTASPEFAWDAVEGVPYYHLILSDQEARVTRDSLGELHLEGANVIWQVITPNTRITYGQPDPSGYFIALNGSPPPLAQGLTYNWIVINNYGNNPAYSSLVEGGVFGFTVRATTPLRPPQLLSPAAGVVLTDEVITFRWRKVAGAQRYQIYLSEVRSQMGSVSSFTIWESMTTDTTIEFPAQTILKNSDYTWKVFALNNSGLGEVSAPREFTYRGPSGKLEIYTQRVDGSLLPRTNVAIIPQAGSSESATLLTTDSGFLENFVQPGLYRLDASKEGYVDTSATAEVRAREVISVYLRLREAPGTIRGTVKDGDARPLAEALVWAKEAVRDLSQSAKSDASGMFTLAVTPGTWRIHANRAGYANSDTLTVTVPAGGTTALPRDLILRRRTAQIVGRAVSPSGEAIFGAQAALSKGNVLLSTTTDANGLFGATVEAGEWRIDVWKSGFVPPSPRRVTVTEGQTVNLQPDLVLTPDAAVVSGFVTDNAKPIADARVRATPLTGPAISTTTSPKGGYTLSLKSGPYEITVARNGYTAPSPTQMTLAAGQTLSGLNFILRPNASFIRGRVTDGVNALAGVIVTASGARDTTGSDGRYNLQVLEGTHEVTVWKEGYSSPSARTVTVRAGERIEDVDFAMTANAAVVKGRITSGGQAVVGAAVLAYTGQDSIGISSGEEGRYALSLKPGTWNLRVTKAGFIPASFSNLTLNPGQQLQGFDITLTANVGTVSGSVVDSRGRAVGGASVETIGKAFATVTDLSGKFSFVVEPGNYSLLASKAGYISQTKSVSVSQGGQVISNFTLGLLAVVKGEVVDPAAVGVQGVQVSAVGVDTARTLTDYGGRYQLHVKGGNYLLMADALGYRPFQKSINATAGDTLRENVTLGLDAAEVVRLRGKLIDSQGLPLADAQLTLSGGTFLIVYTAGDGLYRFDRLQRGTPYTLTPSQRHRFFVPGSREYRPLDGDRFDQNFQGALYGDVSANEKVSSFDGSLILRHSALQNLAPYFTELPRDSLAADVSGNGRISSFDASLVFRYSVGLLTQFPVEGGPGKVMGSAQTRIAQLQTVRENGQLIASVGVDNTDGIFSSEWTLSFDPQKLRPKAVRLSPEAREHQLAFSIRDGEIHLATAGATPLSGSMTIAEVVFDVLSEEATVELERVEFDEGQIPVELPSPAPTYFELQQNYPNPFNATTRIRYQLPQKAKVTLHIYNLLGQVVRVLVDEKQEAGIHTVGWDGRDGGGLPVPTGVYFYRMAAGDFVRVRKLVIIR